MLIIPQYEVLNHTYTLHQIKKFNEQVLGYKNAKVFRIIEADMNQAAYLNAAIAQF